MKIRKEIERISDEVPQDVLANIKQTAKIAVIAIKTNDSASYSTIIENANEYLTKHQRGIFVGMVLSGVEK